MEVNPNVAQLMVRNVDEAVVRELKKRAARRNHSAEQEHREILEQALLRPRRRSLAEVLAAMPDAGEDVDFERRQMAAVRQELDQEYDAAIAAPAPASARSTPADLSSRSRT